MLFIVTQCISIIASHARVKRQTAVAHSEGRRYMQQNNTHVRAVKMPASRPYFLVTSSGSFVLGFSSSCTCIRSPSDTGRDGVCVALCKLPLRESTMLLAGANASASGAAKATAKHRHARHRDAMRGLYDTRPPFPEF